MALGRRRRARPRHRGRRDVAPPNDLFLFEALEARVLLAADIGVPIDDVVTSTPADEDFALGDGNDCYAFEDGWGTDTVTELAGEGIDVLDFSAVTADLTFSINADGTVDVTDGTNSVSADGIEWLAGGQGENRYVFEDGASLAGEILGGPGTDIVDYSAFTTPADVDLAAGSADGTAGVSDVEDVIASPAGGTLTGDTLDNAFTIDADSTAAAATWSVDGGGGSDDRLTIDGDGQAYDLPAPGEVTLAPGAANESTVTYVDIDDPQLTNVTVDPTEVDELISGLEAFADFGQELEAFEDFTDTVPFADDGFGDFADFFAILDQLEVDFAAETIATTTDVLDFLNAWIPEIDGIALVGLITVDALRQTSAHVNPDTGDLRVGFAFSTSRTTTLDVDDSSEVRDAAIEFGDIDLNLATAVSFALTFGVDAADAFFIEVADARASAAASLDGIATDIAIGFLAAAVDDGSIDLDAEVVLDVNGGAPLTISDLNDASNDPAALDAVVDIVATVGDLTLTFDYVVDPGFDPGLVPLDGTLVLSTANFFDTAPAFTVPADADEFRLVTANELLAMLDQLAQSLTGVSGGDLLDLEIPLLDGTTVGDALPFGQAFIDRILSDLVDYDGLLLGPSFTTAGETITFVIDGVPTDYNLPSASYTGITAFVDDLNATLPAGVVAVNEESADSRVTFQPVEGTSETVRLPVENATALTIAGLDYGAQVAGYRSVQELASLLTTAIGVPGLTILAEYEAGELRFDIAWEQHYDLLSVGLDFDVDLGDIAEVTTDATLDVGADLDLVFTFGLELGNTPELVIAPPIFVPDAFGTLTTAATFSVEIFEDTTSVIAIDVTVPATTGDLRTAVQEAIDQALIDAGENDRIDDRLGVTEFLILAPGASATAVEAMPDNGQVAAELRVAVRTGSTWSFGALTEDDASTGTNGDVEGVDGRDDLVGDLQGLLDGMVGAGAIAVAREDDRLTFTNASSGEIEIRFFISEIVAEDAGNRIALTAPPVNVPQTDAPNLVVDRRLEITIAGATDQDRFTNPAYAELGLLSSPIRFDGVLTRAVDFILRINGVDHPISVAVDATNQSVADLVDDINAALGDAGVTDVQAELLVEGGNRIRFTAAAGSGVSSMALPATGDPNAAAVTELGIDPDDDQHVKTTAATLFIEPTDGEPMFTGALSAGVEDVTGSARFGFLEVNLRDSFGVISGEASFSVQNPADAAERITLPTLIGNVGAGRMFFNSADRVGLAPGDSAGVGVALVAGQPLPTDGKLERSARFVVSVTDAATNIETLRNVTVSASSTEDNDDADDLIDDINAALQSAKLTTLTATNDGGFLALSSSTPATLLIPYSLFATPDVSGGLDVQLVLQPAIGSVEPVAPATLALELDVDDWLRLPPTLDDIGSPQGLAINFSGLDIGFYDSLTHLTATDVVDALQEALAFLRELNGTEEDGGSSPTGPLLTVLDTELPLINVSLAGLLDVAADFAPIVDAIAEDPAAGFEQVEALIRDLLGLDPESQLVDLSLDTAGDGVALRIDLTFETAFDSTRPFDLDLEDLADLAGGVPELDGVLSLVGVSTSGDLNLHAGAEFKLSVGVALGADDQEDTEETDGTAAGVEALGFRDGDSAEGSVSAPEAVITAATQPSADRLQGQTIVFTVQVNGGPKIRVEVTPSEETEDQSTVDGGTEIGDDGGELTVRTAPDLFGLNPDNPDDADLEITLRSGEKVTVDLGDADDVDAIVDAISDAHADLDAQLIDGHLVITDSSSAPTGSGTETQTGNPVFLPNDPGDSQTDRRPPVPDPVTGIATSERLDFSLRVGTSGLRFDVHVPEKTYAAGLAGTPLKNAWLEHIETHIKQSMVQAGLMAANDPVAVHASYIVDLTFDANQTLTVWGGIEPTGSVFKIEPLSGSIAILDLGLLGAPVDDSQTGQTTIIGFQLRANVDNDQIIADLNSALAAAGLDAQVQARAGADDVVELTTVDTTAPQTLLIENVDVDDDFIRPFLYDGLDGTGLFLDASVGGENLEFTAQIGPFGFFVVGGSASLDVGLDIYVVPDAGDDDGRHYFSDGFERDDFAFDTTGSAHASLPLFFPTETSPVGSTPLLIDVDLVGYFDAKDPDTPAPGTPSVTITAPDLTAFPTPTLIGMLSNPEFVIDGLDALLQKIQEALNSEVLSVTLPVIGDQLTEAAQFIEDFREDVLSYLSAKLREGGLNPITIVHETLYNIFGGAEDGDPQALGVLGFAVGDSGFGELTAAAAPDFDADGRLTREARFLITVGEDDPVLIVIDPENDDVEPGLEGLVAAINVSLAARGVERVEATAAGSLVRLSAPGQSLSVDKAHAVPLDLFGLRVGALGILNDANGDFLVDIEDVLKTGFGLFDDYGQFDMLLGQAFVYGQSLDFDIGLPALGLSLDADVEVFLDWQLDFGFGVDQDVGFYFATDAHPNAPEGPEDLGPELTVTGGAELAGEATQKLLGFENRDDDDSGALSSAPLTDADFSVLRSRGADLTFRLTLDDGETAEETHLVTIASGALAGITDIDALVVTVNGALVDAGLAPLVTAQALTDATGGQRLQLVVGDSRSLTIRGDAASAEGRLGFLVVEGVDQGVAGIDLEFSVDLTDPGTTPDGKLAFSEIIAESTTFDSLITAMFDGRAALDLGVAVNFGLLGLDASLLPNVSLDVLVDWDFVDVDTSTDTTSFGGTPSVNFENIALDLGSFISDFAGPFLNDLGEVLEPLDFFLDPVDGLLYQRLPVISDLMGQTINIKRLVELFDTEDRITPFLDALAELYYFIDLVTDAAADANLDRDGDGEPDGLVLQFGSLEFPDLRGLSDLSSLSLGGSGSNASDDTVGQGGTTTDVDDLPDGAAKSFSKNLTSPGKGSFDFPILTDPSNILNLLIGNAADVTLVTYDLPPFGFNFDYRQVFPIYPPLFATLRGFFSATIDLGFGYDALGLSQFSVTENPFDLINGFFISDVDFDTGIDVPELTFTGGIAAGATLNVAVASAGVEGGIDVSIFFDLSDPNLDTKVRLGELEANLILNNFNPIAIFDVSGKMDAFLQAYVEVLFGLWSKEFELARVTLAEFDFEFARAPVLAQQASDGELTLNVGTNAASRFHGDLRDGGEKIIGETRNGVLYLKSSAGGLEQRYDGVTKIVAHAGAGNDYIDLSGVAGIEIELHGGSGNDVLIGGSGINHLFGGEGDDRLVGGISADQLSGGTGDDEITGNGGADELFGDAGNDLLAGGGGNDTLDGGTGDDVLAGDGGQNTYVFGANWGNDVVNEPAGLTGGDDIWDFTSVRHDIVFNIGADDSVPPIDRAVMTADSLGNTVRQAGFGIGKVMGGKGADFFHVRQTGDVEMLLDGHGGSDTYITFAPDPAVPVPQLVAIKDVGNFWDLDTLIFEGSEGVDVVGVTDQQIVNVAVTPPQTVSYRSDAPDESDVAAFDALGFGLVAATELISGRTDGSLDQLARLELSVGGRPAELVVVDPDDVGGDQTLSDLADALNTSLEIADLDDQVVARVTAGVLTLVSLTGEILEAAPVITGPGLEVLEVFGRGGDDVIGVQSTPDFMAVAISAGTGDDALFVGPLLDEIKGGPLTGPLVIQGDEGFNTLVISDEVDPTDNEGVLTRDTLTGFGIGVAIEFLDIDDLTLRLGSGNDVLDVTGTNAGSTTILAGAGADVVEVASASGTVTVDGQADDDLISLNASDAGSTVALLGDDGSDVINVRTMAGAVDVLGGDGGDVITVGTEAGTGEPGTLNRINGPLSIDGGAGDDLLVVDDRADGTDTLFAASDLSAPTELGRLSGDARFDVTLDGEDPITIVVVADLGILQSSRTIAGSVAATGVLSVDASFVLDIGGEQIDVLVKRDVANAGIADLEADLVAALEKHGIDPERVSVAVETNGGESRVVFTSRRGEDLTLAVADDPGAAELGLVDGQDAAFANATQADLLDDINQALADAGLGGRVEAQFEAGGPFGQLTLTLLDGTAMLISGVNDAATNDLGLVDYQFLQPDNSGTHDLVDDAGILRARVTGLGMGTDGGGQPGIVYHAVELAVLGLGAGHDVFNVQGTLPGTLTVLNTNGGDDLVNVSSTAPENDAERGRLLGTVAEILGDLEIDAGDGANTLRISDLESSVGKSATLTPTRLTGFAPAEIRYTAATGFSGGIDIWAGTGDDAFLIEGIRSLDVTSLYLSSGADTLTAVDLGAPGDGLLAVFGESGDDIIDAADWTAPAVLLGDAGELSFDGAARRADALIGIEVFAPTDGGDDVIIGGAGDDLIIGGAGNDQLDGRGGSDVVIGDIGTVDLDGGVLSSLAATMPDIAGADHLLGGADDDVLIGGAGRDTIEGEAGNDLIFGDGGTVGYRDGSISEASVIDLFTGDADQIAGGQMLPGAKAGGDGNDVLIGGAGNDILYGTLEEDVLIGDYGSIVVTNGLISTVQVLGQRPLDLAASTMFGLYNGPLPERAPAPELPTPTARDGTALPDLEARVSTGNPAVGRTFGHGGGVVVETLEQVRFAFDSATLLPGSFVELDALVARLAADPLLRVEVVGHTDDLGAADYNLDLSARRADAVRSYLIEHGIADDRLRSRGAGETEPRTEGVDEASRAQNRRVEIFVSRNEAAAELGTVIGFAAWQRGTSTAPRRGLVDWKPDRRIATNR